VTGTDACSYCALPDRGSSMKNREQVP